MIEKIKNIWNDKKIPPTKRIEKIDAIVKFDRKAISYFNSFKNKIKWIKFIDCLKDLVFSNLQEREVSGSQNYNWKNYKGKTVIHPTYKSKSLFPTDVFADYIGICDVYIKTIEQSEYGIFDKNSGGYSLSRLNGYEVEYSSNVPKSGQIFYPSFSFYNNLISKEHTVNRIRGIMNGSFDRVANTFFIEVPGWEYHGGVHDDNVHFNGESATLNYLGGNPPTILQHNRFYIPYDANSISFLLKTEVVLDNILRIKIQDVLSKKMFVTEMPLQNVSTDFTEHFIPIGDDFKDKVVTISFELFAVQKDSKPALIEIDEVRLSNTANGVSLASTIEPVQFDKKAFNTYPCSEQSNLKSTPYYQNNAQNFTTEIAFKNNSNETVQTYFIDFEGNKKLYSSIPPNGIISQPTYINHIWLIADKNNECLLIIDPLKRTKQEVEIKSMKQQNLDAQKSEVQEVEQPNNVKIFNGGFENNTNWSFSGGNVLFKNGTVSMQPEKKKIPLKLKHLSFQVPSTAHTLEVTLDKSKVGEANFKIMLTDISTMKMEEIYSEKISQSLTKFNQGLNDLNKTLESGEITITKKEGKFDIISVDLSRYAGKTVSLELSYETLGLGKPALIIDDVSIK